MTRLINADELIALFNSRSTINVVGDGLCKAIISQIEGQPTVDAVPVRHGKWLYGNDFHWYTASCSECGYQRRTDIKADRWNQWNYCPNCGADMRGEQDE